MTTKPTTICIDDIDYYIADDLRDFDKNYFFGCSKTSRIIVDKKKIAENDYIYLTTRDNKWKISTKDCKKAKLAISREWIENNMPSMSNGTIKEEYETEPKQITIDKKDLLQIDGKTINLPIVGTREYNKCYFKVKYISEYFDAPTLAKIILNKDRNGYIEGKHYVYFIRRLGIKDDNRPIKKILYLTYNGLIRFLFVSHNDKATAFQEWASKILFTHQVGTTEQKRSLVKELTGIDATEAVKTLNTSVSDITCVYLFVIGTVKSLRKSMKIPSPWNDDSYVCKYGCENNVFSQSQLALCANYGETCDLRRRTNEHVTTFEKLGDELKLKRFVYIDKSNTSKAESSLRKRLTIMNVSCSLCGHDELVILDKKQLKDTLSIYRELGILFGADINEYKAQTEKRIMILEHTVEMQKKDIEILQLKLEKAQKKK